MSRAARADRERNDLHGGDHLAGNDRREGFERRERDVGIDLVEAVDAGRIDHDDARGFGEQVGAPGEGAVDAHALARDRRREFGGGGILGNVARLDPRDRDRR